MLIPFLFSSGRRRETSNCSRGKRACSVLKNVGLAVVGLVTAAANKPNVRHTLVPESIPFLLRCLSLMTRNRQGRQDHGAGQEAAAHRL
jgi:hypothetical protein